MIFRTKGLLSRDFFVQQFPQLIRDEGLKGLKVLACNEIEKIKSAANHAALFSSLPSFFKPSEIFTLSASEKMTQKKNAPYPLSLVPYPFQPKGWTGFIFAKCFPIPFSIHTTSYQRPNL